MNNIRFNQMAKFWYVTIYLMKSILRQLKQTRIETLKYGAQENRFLLNYLEEIVLSKDRTHGEA